MPRVLFSTPECRAVVVDLGGGEDMRDHRVRERAIVQVVRGIVTVDASGESVDCEAGGLLVFEPSEPHSIRARTDARLLLLLAPWPADEHYAGDAGERAQQLPPNASVEPLEADDPSEQPTQTA